VFALDLMSTYEGDDLLAFRETDSMLSTPAHLKTGFFL
jgi:hypothetical protein